MTKVRIIDPEGHLRIDVYIYALAGVDGVVRYIGATINPRERYLSHLRDARGEETKPVYLWIRSLLERNETMQMVILERCERTNATFHPRERHWIQVYGGTEQLLNQSESGYGGGPWLRGMKRSQHVKDAVSKAQKGRKRTPEQIEQMRLVKTGQKHLPDCKHCIAVRGTRSKKVG